MLYEDALAFLSRLGEGRIRLSLGNVCEAARRLGNPQGCFKVVHIVGTNGKGSTAAFLEKILQHNGYRVGLFTSPHLLDIRERIRVAGRIISEKDFADYIAKVKNTGVELTYFEVLVLAAFDYFASLGVDVAIVEAGLGGRYDATNICQPAVVIITPISIDHVQYLGRSLRGIAVEKAAVIKEGSFVVSAVQTGEVEDVIQKRCTAAGAGLIYAQPALAEGYEMLMSGKHQVQNAACAIEAARVLARLGFEISGVEKAVATTRWPARLDVVSNRPFVMVDCAHNVAGMKVLVDYLVEDSNAADLQLVLGVLRDKDVVGMLSELRSVVRSFYAVHSHSRRAMPSYELTSLGRKLGFEVVDAKDVCWFLNRVVSDTESTDRFLFAGSVYTAAEVLRYFNVNPFPEEKHG